MIFWSTIHREKSDMKVASSSDSLKSIKFNESSKGSTLLSSSGSLSEDYFGLNSTRRLKFRVWPFAARRKVRDSRVHDALDITYHGHKDFMASIDISAEASCA